MKAQVNQINDVNVFYISDKLTLDGTENLQKIIYKNYLTEKNVFCLDGLRFVGSTGVTVLLETFQKLNSVTGKPIKFSNVNSEYHKIFLANLVGIYECYESVDHALYSYRQPVQPQPVAQPNAIDKSFLHTSVPGGATVSSTFPVDNSVTQQTQAASSETQSSQPEINTIRSEMDSPDN